MLGKALGRGLLPVSIYLARREVIEVFQPGDHGSTFGGNPLAAAVGLGALIITQTQIDWAVVEHIGRTVLEQGEVLKRSRQSV